MAQHVIIFDGPDRTGKTEISTELSRHLGIPRFKNNRESMFFERDPGYFVNALKYGDPYFTSFLKQTGTSVILDRSFPSEYVYPILLGRESNRDILRMVDTMYADINAKIVITHRSSYAGIVDDQFDVLDSTKLQRLDELYREFARWTSCKVMQLCVDDEDLQREISAISKFLE